MTDVHTHLPGNDSLVIEFLANRDFFGTHPWDASMYDEGLLVSQLEANPKAFVGEIGLDRLKSKDITQESRQVFISQLEVASQLKRPVVLHGAKCWGEVVKTIQGVFSLASMPPSFLFHGFSRSDGLINDIAKLNGFISVGPQILNDHAVNYRKMICKVPLSMLLFETDRTANSPDDLPTINQILAKTAQLRSVNIEELERITDSNAKRFAQI